MYATVLQIIKISLAHFLNLILTLDLTQYCWNLNNNVFINTIFCFSCKDNLSQLEGWIADVFLFCSSYQSYRYINRLDLSQL